MSFGGQRAGRQLDAGRVDALVLAEHAALRHRRLDLDAVAALDPQLDDAVREQQRVARMDTPREPVEARRHASRAADEVAGGDDQPIADVECERRAVLQPPGADLRTAEVLQNRDLPTGPLRRGAHTP